MCITTWMLYCPTACVCVRQSVCAWTEWLSYSQTLFMVGMLLGSLFGGAISDRYHSLGKYAEQQTEIKKTTTTTISPSLTFVSPLPPALFLFVLSFLGAGMASVQCCWCACACSLFVASPLPLYLIRCSSWLCAAWRASAAAASTSAPSAWVRTYKEAARGKGSFWRLVSLKVIDWFWLLKVQNVPDKKHVFENCLCINKDLIVWYSLTHAADPKHVTLMMWPFNDAGLTVCECRNQELWKPPCWDWEKCPWREWERVH